MNPVLSFPLLSKVDTVTTMAFPDVAEGGDGNSSPNFAVLEEPPDGAVIVVGVAQVSMAVVSPLTCACTVTSLGTADARTVPMALSLKLAFRVASKFLAVIAGLNVFVSLSYFDNVTVSIRPASVLLILERSQSIDFPFDTAVHVGASGSSFLAKVAFCTVSPPLATIYTW